MAEKIPLSEYSEKHNMHYKTALRRFKDKNLENVSGYFTEDAGNSVRYYVIDDTPNFNKAKETAKKIFGLVDEIKKETDNLKENLEL